jgi:hypothetical protein
MGTQTYPKNGQVSQKEHDSGGKSKASEERYLDRFSPIPTFGGGPERFDRKFGNNYRKESLEKDESPAAERAEYM